MQDAGGLMYCGEQVLEYIGGIIHCVALKISSQVSRFGTLIKFGNMSIIAPLSDSLA
jgi:hypothetical protein